MGIKQTVKKKGSVYLEKYRHKRRIQGEENKFKDPRRVAIYSSVILTNEQEKQIDDLYINHYGKKIPYIWHRHFTAFTGKFDPFYIPETLFIPEFEAYMNSQQGYTTVFADKNVLPLIAKSVGVKMPRTIISCANGILRDDNYHIIRWNAIKRLMPEGNCFVKPAVDSDSGTGCRFVNKKEDNLICLLKKMGNDFVIQEAIHNSNSIKKIYPDGVNTFRIITYIWKNAIHHMPIIMRIGRDGSFLDNAHAGGMFIAVNDDGTLQRTAFTEFKEEYPCHPNTRCVFEGYKVGKIDKVIKAAKMMHTAIPQLGVINWDFTIDNCEEPVLIEANTSGGSIWMSQMAWGCGVFGERTVEILEWLKMKNESFGFNKRS